MNILLVFLTVPPPSWWWLRFIPTLPVWVWILVGHFIYLPPWPPFCPACEGG